MPKSHIYEVTELGCATKLSDPPHPAKIVVFSLQNTTFVNSITFYSVLETESLILITGSGSNYIHFSEMRMSPRQFK